MVKNDNELGHLDDINYLIWRIFKFWQRGRQKLLGEFGLTSSQMELLVTIYHISKHNTEVTQILLSQKTEIDPMTTSTILRNLQKKGLINRRYSTIDTRARIVEITDKGTHLLEKAIVKINKEQTLLFENIDYEALKNQLQILLQEMNRLSKINEQLNII